MGCETSFAAVLKGTAFCTASSIDPSSVKQGFISCMVQRICKNKNSLVGQDCTKIDIVLIEIVGALLWSAGEAKFAPKPAGASCGGPDWPCKSAECANGTCINGICCEKQMVLPAGTSCSAVVNDAGCPLDCQANHSCVTVDAMTGKRICCKVGSVAQGEGVPFDCESCGTGTNNESMEKVCLGSQCACCRPEGPMHGEIGGSSLASCLPKGKKDSSGVVIGASGQQAWYWNGLLGVWCQKEAPLGWVKNSKGEINYLGTPTLVGKDRYGFAPSVIGLETPNGSSLKPCGIDGGKGCGGCPPGETCVKMMRGPDDWLWTPMTPEDWASKGCVKNPNACTTACVCGKSSLGKVQC